MRESSVLFRQVKHLLAQPRSTWTEAELHLVREYQRVAKQEQRAGLPQTPHDRRSNPAFRAWMAEHGYPWTERRRRYMQWYRGQR